jgi:predicted ferric reductase
MWSTLEQPRAGASVLPTTHAPTTSAPITAPWSPPAFEQPTSPARANPTAVLAIVWIGAAATVALWWFNTTSISGFGDWLTNAGRITGLLAGYSVVVLVALMARLPPLERGVGSDRLARWHSMGGRYTVCLIVAHALLITWGYAVVAHTNVVHQEWTLLRSYPDVLMATVAGLLFVGVGISSMRAARRKLRYETWYYLHLYTYLAIALAFAHQFASGAEFMSSLSARIAWVSLYASVGLLLIWYRIVVPVDQAFRHRLRVQSVVRESPNAVSIVLHGQNLHQLQAESGQFFRFRFLSRDLWWAINPYSLSAPVTNDFMRITVKDLGDHSSRLATVQPGVRVVAEGPFGAFTAHHRRRRRVLLIAAGVGVTPIRALFETLPMTAPGDVTLIYRARREEEVLFRGELESIARSRQARLYIVVGSRRELGGDPLALESLAQLPNLADHDVYLCGPAPMQAGVTKALRDLGVPRRHIHVESYEF